ncbi:sensor histidine kinase [Streptomyces sp. NPDC002132]|uniref:sensor histidine kinase n=1 Tax=unclassified Streptomyces TaxID=2593676 RepID=UPI003327CACE
METALPPGGALTVPRIGRAAENSCGGPVASWGPVAARVRRNARETLRAVLYLAGGLPTGLVWLVSCTVLLGIGVATLPLVVGAGLICAAALSGIPLGAVERSRLRWFSGGELPRGGVRGGLGPAGGGPLTWVGRRLTEPATWRELAYAVVHSALSLAEFALVLASVVVPASLLTAPLLRLFTPDGRFRVAVFLADSTSQALVLVLCGGVCLALSYVVLTRYAALRARLSAAVLARDADARDRDQERHIGSLVRSRARILDAYDAERRRIERDLHDGAQQRLTGLVMTLGLARLAVADSGPETRELVERAHEQARLTLTELRDLVHGIFPAILADRGLTAALTTLAEEFPLPVTTDLEPGGRPDDAVEAATYFVACEALSNVAKHSGATEARLSLRRTGSRLVLEVYDNGRGGADAEAGSGLTGLADRVAALEGTVHLSSPLGGPTLLHVEIPCAS